MPRSLPLVAGLLALAGCGESKPATVPVAGRVTLNGQPAAGALVVFHPRDKGRENDPKPLATAADDGTYALTTFEDKDGAPAGEYGVTVVWLVKGKAAKFTIGDGGGGTDKLGGRYGNPQQPKLTASVKPGQPNAFDFELQ